MPERFGLTYTGADNAEHPPVMIHRALMGSYERFIGILLEHFAGELPLWLAPMQAIVLPIADRHVDYGAGSRDGCATPGCGSSSTTAPSRLGGRSVTPSCARFPTCSWSATASRSAARSRCASTGGGDAGAVAVDEFAERVSARQSKLGSTRRAAAILGLVDPAFHHTRPGAA